MVDGIRVSSTFGRSPFSVTACRGVERCRLALPLGVAIRVLPLRSSSAFGVHHFSCGIADAAFARVVPWFGHG
jgi:hypothetical protein